MWKNLPLPPVFIRIMNAPSRWPCNGSRKVDEPRPADYSPLSTARHSGRLRHVSRSDRWCSKSAGGVPVVGNNNSPEAKISHGQTDQSLGVIDVGDCFVHCCVPPSDSEFLYSPTAICSPHVLRSLRQCEPAEKGSFMVLLGFRFNWRNSRSESSWMTLK